jgi:4-amino-4-deoxy-L-arabinose transferase-like glycosyltransferase
VLARSGAALLAAVLLYLLYFHNLTAAGLLGPDEPRYAFIGREMARSFDWITPRLWSEPWFEKPALLYWMGAVGATLRLGPELAPRLPVSLLSAAFLLFYWWWLRRELGGRAATFASLMLATSGAWIAYSRVAVTDLPLSTTFAAAVLLLWPWLLRGETRWLTAAAAMLGAAVLAKGLVPLVLIAPAFWFARHRWRDLLRPAPMLAFVAVAAPWYIAVTLRHGGAFIDEFFVRHHFSRFASEALQHQQPFWFYIPVLLGLFFPWTFVILSPVWRSLNLNDARLQLLLAISLWGLLFFSASTNKLPGYLLVLFPLVAALAGAALSRAPSARLPLTLTALLLGLFPLIAMLLPEGLRSGIRNAGFAHVPYWWMLPAVALAACVWWLESRGRRDACLLLIAIGVALGVTYIGHATLPEIDRSVSARGLWKSIQPHANETCAGASLHRALRYGLNYYAPSPLPDCELRPMAYRVRQSGRQVFIDGPGTE